jgi:putative drug exporter of the RND superfamily
MNDTPGSGSTQTPDSREPENARPATGRRRRPGRQRDQSARRPRRVLAIAALLVVGWVLLGGFGGSYTGRLSEVQTNDNANFLPKDAESTEVQNAVERLSDEESVPLLVVIESNAGPLRPNSVGAAQSLVRTLPELAVPDLGDGVSVGDYLAGSDPLAVIPSRDGEAALIVVPIQTRATTEVVDDRAPLLAITEAVRDRADETFRTTGATATVGGFGGLIADFAVAFGGIDGILLGVALAVVLVILLVVYRSPILPLAVLASALFGLGLAAVVVYQLAKNDVIQLSGQSQGILFILVVGAATDYALLLVSRFREELHDEPNSWVAMTRAWRGAVEPIAASAATVILGLLCLLLADLRSTAGLGPVGALGVAGALVASLTFLPAVLVLLGRAAFWPVAPKLDHQHAEDAIGSRSLWGRVAGLVGRRARATWVITLGVLLAFGALAPTFEAEGVTIEDTFLTDVESVRAQEALSAHFAAGAAQPVQILVPVDDASSALRVVNADPGVESAFVGLEQPLPGQPAAAPPTVDGRTLIQATTTGAADSAAAEATVKRLRGSLDEVSTDAVVGGNAAVNLDVLEASSRDLRVIVPTILLVIFLVLCLLLRSIVAPLVLVIANVVSFAATVGIAALVFEHVFGFGGSDPAIPLYGFVFLVALGIDYSIFLMTRVREEALVRGTRPGILVGLAVTGGVITSAGLVLAATFSALAVLPLVFLVQIAFIVAFGVLLDTFVVRSLLVPALAHDIGGRVWWPRMFAGDRPADESPALPPGAGDPTAGGGDPTADPAANNAADRPG